MQTHEIRKRFLDHFVNAGHTEVPSASVILDDPNLLERHTARACLAAEKFDPVAMGMAYTEIYRKALTSSANPTD